VKTGCARSERASRRRAAPGAGRPPAHRRRASPRERQTLGFVPPSSEGTEKREPFFSSSKFSAGSAVGFLFFEYGEAPGALNFVQLSCTVYSVDYELVDFSMYHRSCQLT
jgi:hypothetical protein